MPFSVSQLNTFYSNANLGITPSAAESLLIQAFATEDASGSLTDAQTLSSVLTLSQDKTDVALLTYQFFTGASPSIAGLQFLVNGTTNPNDLGSPFFAQFDKENRYYNFAINLATASSSAASFAATYGTLTFAQAVTAAYENIVGSAVVGVAQATAAEAAITALQPFFASVAASRAPAANQDIATKAIAIGYILEEAQKADVGAYARAVDQFLTQLATTGTAPTGNLLTLFPPSNVAGVTFNLTAGIDNFLGSSGNDTVNGTAQINLSPLDNINGGGGSNVFNLTDSNVAITGVPASAVLTNFAILNLESVSSVTFNSTVDAGAIQLNSVAGTTANLTAATTTNVASVSTGGATVAGGANVTVSDTGGVDVVSGSAGAISVTDTAQAANNVTVNNGTSVNVAVTGSTGGVIAIGGTTAPTGAVTVSEGVSGAGATGAAIQVTGGTTVGVTETATNAKNTTATFGSVTVTGTATTTAVSVTETPTVTAAAAVPGVVGGAVAITDVNAGSATKLGTITSVSLTNTGAGATISDNNLTSLSLTGADGVVTVTDANLQPLAEATTLGLALTSVPAATAGGGVATSLVDTNNEISTINISNAGSSALTGITDTGLVTLSVGGAGSLALGAFTPSVKSLTISGAAGLTGAGGNPLDVSGGVATLAVTDTSSGAVSVKIASTQTFSGAASSGKDTVTISADATKSIAAGTAVNNELILSGAGGAFVNTPTKISGFTVLGTDAGSSGVFDLSTFPTITALDVTGTGGSVQFTKVVAGTTLSIDASIANGVTYQAADATGAADSVTATLGTAATTGITTGGQLTFQDSVAAGFGSVTLNSISAANPAPPAVFTNTVTTLNDTGLTSLTFTGNASTTIGTLIDNGSTLAVTNNGVAGVTDSFSLTTSHLTSLTLVGAVAATVTDSAATFTVNGATDTAGSTIAYTGTGTSNITLGGGANVVSDTGTGTNTVTIGASGTHAESVALGLGTNTVAFGTHTGIDNVTVAAHSAAAGASPATFALSALVAGLNSAATSGDTITFGDAAATGTVAPVPLININTYANTTGQDSTQLTTAVNAVLDATNGGLGLAQHHIAAFNFQGNTYIVEQGDTTGHDFVGAGTEAANGVTIVELVGIVPVTTLSVATTGVLHLNG